MSYLFLETASGLHSVHACAGTGEEFKTPVAGKYQIQCWGASGGDSKEDNVSSGWTKLVLGGRGGYCFGITTLHDDVYVFVGEKGVPHVGEGGTGKETFNGGGKQGYIYYNGSGGGGTDIRLKYASLWKNFESLKSRIIVAGGGGGAQHYMIGSPGGNGGGLIGDDGNSSCAEDTSHPVNRNITPPTGGTQTSGGNAGYTWETKAYSGGFGYGGNNEPTNDHGGGGGGGYYGGGGGAMRGGAVSSGAGGSSFISGYTGCNAISKNSTENNIVHTGQPNHYSGYVFSNAVMKAGNEVMPSPKGGTETGHTGNGYVIIHQL